MFLVIRELKLIKGLNIFFHIAFRFLLNFEISRLSNNPCVVRHMQDRLDFVSTAPAYAVQHADHLITYTCFMPFNMYAGHD